MIVIDDIRNHPHLRSQIEAWKREEWPTPKPRVLDEVALLVALEGATCVGFAQLVLYKGEHWIDAVVVDKNHRRKGIALKLIGAMEKIVTPLKALTDLPSLYEKAGWVSTTPGKSTDVVMSKR